MGWYGALVGLSGLHALGARGYRGGIWQAVVLNPPGPFGHDGLLSSTALAGDLYKFHCWATGWLSGNPFGKDVIGPGSFYRWATGGWSGNPIGEDGIGPGEFH